MSTAGVVTGNAPTAQTTTGTVPITQLTVTATLTAGTYLLLANCATASNTAGRYSQTQLVVDGTPLSINVVNHAAVTVVTMSNFIETGALTAGSHTFLIQFQRSTASGLGATISCSDATMAIMRIF